MSVPGELHALVERFERDRDSYRSGRYNEAQARVGFVNPLLGLLGWDVENRQGRPEAYRDVVYEDRVKVGGGTKVPDYGFYAGGRRRFFLEAKKPSVDIAGDLAPAVQLRRYAWSARLPLSVLTDFEEFAIYDCRSEPEKVDSATTARLELFTYDRYADEAVWERISSVFSREAVLDGSLERYAEENRKRRGKETVDAAFLREIEGWRSDLARDIAARNDLNTRGLNFAVQMTIDRIIFLRMAEDRGIEQYERLMALLNGGDTYRRLCEVFRDADDRYNSGLFHFRGERGRDEEPDRLTLATEIDDTVLKDIIRGLYYPESPYEFSVLPVDVLGQVYEQFLGRVIRLEDGHTATVEEKPEVRKAGGVYYTPTYIVDYIVEKTVGKLLEGKRPGPQIFESPKIVGLTTSKTIELMYDSDSSVYVTDAMYVFSLPSSTDPWAFLAVMQSKTFLFLYRIANQGESRVIPQIKASKLHTLPYPRAAVIEIEPPPGSHSVRRSPRHPRR